MLLVLRSNTGILLTITIPCTLSLMQAEVLWEDVCCKRAQRSLTLEMVVRQEAQLVAETDITDPYAICLVLLTNSKGPKRTENDAYV